MKTARLVVTLGSLCRDRFGVQHHPSLGVLRAVCRVSRVHVPCVMRCFFSRKNKKQKQAADPNSLGGTFSLRTRVGAPASVPFSFFFSFAFFFFFPVVFNFKCSCFFPHFFVRICVSLELHATTFAFPGQDRFEEYELSSKFARAPCVL